MTILPTERQEPVKPELSYKSYGGAISIPLVPFVRVEVLPATLPPHHMIVLSIDNLDNLYL